MAFEYYNVFELIYLIHIMVYLRVYLRKYISFVHKTYDDYYIVQSYHIYKIQLAKDIYSIYIYQVVYIEPFCYRVCILNSQTSANYIAKSYIYHYLFTYQMEARVLFHKGHKVHVGTSRLHHGLALLDRPSVYQRLQLQA